jgi:hypothetical protein
LLKFCVDPFNIFFYFRHWLRVYPHPLKGSYGMSLLF